MICNFTDGIAYGSTVSDMLNYIKRITDRITTTTTTTTTTTIIKIKNYLARSSWISWVGYSWV